MSHDLLVGLSLLSSLLLSYGGTWIARRVALRKAIVDVPSDRSLHETPTPRGGGIAFAVLLLVALAAYLVAGVPNQGLWIALLGGGALVTLVGGLDDCRDLPSYVRLGLYAVAAAWAAAWTGGFPYLALGFGVLHLGWPGFVVSWALILAFTNIYNFMDGMDGFAASEGAIVSLAAGILLHLSGQPYPGWLFVGLAVALVGFLPWNWHPAKIFMGDVGSNLLGFVFATTALSTGRFSEVSIWIWACLLGVFVVDGFMTFTRRLLRRLPPHQAHRSHAYQGAVQRGLSHARVTSVIALINVALAGVAIGVWLCPQGALPLTLLAYAGLATLHLRFSPLKDVPKSRGKGQI